MQINRGRPEKHYALRPVGEFLRRLFDYLEDRAWRALLVTKYPDLPSEALALEDVLGERYEATPDDIAAIDDVKQPLYEQHGFTLAAAAHELRARVDCHRRLYGAEAWRGDYEPLAFPPGVTFSNAKQFRDAIRDQEIDRHGGIYENRYELAARTGRTLTAHRVAAAQAHILSIPVFAEYPVAPNGNLLPQAANLEALERHRVLLRAGNGDETVITPNQDWGAWLAVRGGRVGAVWRVWERTVDKRDRPDLVSEGERRDRAMISRRQKSASDRRNRSEERPIVLNVWEEWLIRQGEMGADLFGLQPLSQHDPCVYMTPHGGIFDRADIWRGVITQVREGAGMPTYTDFTAEQESDEPPPAEHAEAMDHPATEKPGGLGDGGERRIPFDSGGTADHCPHVGIDRGGDAQRGNRPHSSQQSLHTASGAPDTGSAQTVGSHDVTPQPAEVVAYINGLPYTAVMLQRRDAEIEHRESWLTQRQGGNCD